MINLPAVASSIFVNVKPPVLRSGNRRRRQTDFVFYPPTVIGELELRTRHAVEHKTMNLAGIFVREEGRFMDPANKGRFYHDGRFQRLIDVVNHYNTFSNLGLTDPEKNDLIEYLKSL
jgi:hypothetical protein